MNKNVLIVLAGGFVIAILVAVLVQAGLSEKKPEVAQSNAQILVAARDLRVGTDIAETDVKWQEWPETMVFAGAIRRTEAQTPKDALSGRLKERVAAGQPLSKSMVVDAAKGNMLAATLREGYRAVGIPVRVETIAGGLIGVGDYVDVVMTYKLTRTGDSTIARKFATETILENVRVLGIDTKSVAQDIPDEEGKKAKAKSKMTITLEVNPVGAEKISLASEMGEITLSLRPLGDNTEIAGDKATTDIGLSKVSQQMIGGNGGGLIRIYNGNQVQSSVAGGSTNAQIGRDDEMMDLEEPDQNMDEDFVPPGDMLDAVREGISEGISQGITQSIQGQGQ